MSHRNFTPPTRATAAGFSICEHAAQQIARNGRTRRGMDVAKALTIVIDTAAPSCDAAALNPLRRLLDHASPLLALAIEDCADRAAHAAAMTHDPGARRALACALRRACGAAIAHIPSIDQRSTRNRAKQALKAVAALERLAAILDASENAAHERAA